MHTSQANQPSGFGAERKAIYQHLGQRLVPNGLKVLFPKMKPIQYRSPSRHKGKAELQARIAIASSACHLD